MSNIIDFKVEKEKLGKRYKNVQIERVKDKEMAKKTPIEVIRLIRSNEELRKNVPECARRILEAFEVNAEKEYVPIVGILKSLGINTYKNEMTILRLSAYIAVDPKFYEKYGTAKIACVNEKDSAGHIRFALAHELAHYIFDYDETKHVIFFNTYMKDSEEKDECEKRANEFAANLLMPKEVFLRKKEYFEKKLKNNKPDVIVELAEHFGVSTASVIKRYEELGILV